MNGKLWVVKFIILKQMPLLKPVAKIHHLFPKLMSLNVQLACWYMLMLGFAAAWPDKSLPTALVMNISRSSAGTKT